MRVFKNSLSFKKGPKRKIVLALGNFDGIHLGHQKLLDYVVQQAEKLNARPAVFTFREHPQAVLHPAQAPERLQLLDQKLKFFRDSGIEICFLQHFDRNFSSLSATEFVKKILVNRLGIQEICLGYNARFGHGREGDVDLLRKLGKEYGFKVFQAKPVVDQGTPISSTVIRNLICEGEMKHAAKLLARPWSVAGKVKHGKKNGKKIGFPTANLDWKGYVRPALGVYAVLVKQAGTKKVLKGAANFGFRPTWGASTQPVLEVHLLNFKKNIYGKEIEVFFMKHLRNEKKFESAESLKQQIQKDIHQARKIFKGVKLK